MLEKIEVAERPQTAPGLKSSLKTVPLTARLPEGMIKELKALGGRKSHHVERALTLYLRVMRQHPR